MKGIEDIFSGKNLIAKIFRKNIQLSGVQFFTDSTNPLQIGIHERLKGVSLSPHIHRLTSTLKINTIQEILFVQRGKIKMTFYTNIGKYINQSILNKGDSVLLIDGGHGVEFLKDSRVFEVKQGPYPGSQNAKIYINK